MYKYDKTNAKRMWITLSKTSLFLVKSGSTSAA